MTSNMMARLLQAGEPSKLRVINADDPLPMQTDLSNSEAPVNGPNDYRFSIGKLPVWAKKQIFERSGSLTPPSPTLNQKGNLEHNQIKIICRVDSWKSKFCLSRSQCRSTKG
jgi:hypothetical protein